MDNQGPDIVMLYRQELEKARQDKQAFMARHFGVSDEASVERVAKKRKDYAANENGHWASQVRRKDEALETLTGTLRGVWRDLETMHAPGCNGNGNCPACEAQGRIEGVL